MFCETDAVKIDPFWGTETTNTPICTESGYDAAPRIISDGQGGAIITWWNYDIYAQRIDRDGNVLWLANGTPICKAVRYQQAPRLVSDGVGGAIIAWEDERNINVDIYAQRVNASGVVQWKTDGVPICNATNDQLLVQIIDDDSGGAIMTWDDKRNGIDCDIYAQRINSTGDIQWPENGIVICNASGNQMEPKLVPDGSGGGIITWEDKRNGTGFDIYAQRVDTTGNVHWMVNGTPVSLAPGNQTNPEIISDNGKGAVIAWWDDRGGEVVTYAQRLNESGQPLWQLNGTSVCNSNGSQLLPVMVIDEQNNTIFAWWDGRNAANIDVYAQKLNETGAKLWNVNGTPVCTDKSHQMHVKILSDGSGGAIICWTDTRSGYGDIYIQHINASGDAQWTLDGEVVCTASRVQGLPEMIHDGEGGIIIVWEDSRASFATEDIYAHRFGMRILPEGELYAHNNTLFQHQLRSNDDYNATWTIDTNAGWLEINATSGLLHGTPDGTQIGEYYVEVTAEHDGFWDRVNLTITVKEPPKWTVLPANNSITLEDEYYSFDIQSDVEGVGGTFYSINTGPAWLEINAFTGVISGTPDNSYVGKNLINISITDVFGGASYYQFVLEVENVNDPPEITTPDQNNAEENKLYSVQYKAIDIDPTNDALTWQMATSAGWLQFNSSNHLTGTPTNNDMGSYWVNVSVHDGNGAMDFSNFSLAVVNVNDPPVITNDNVLTVLEDHQYRVDYEATDIDPTHDVLTWFLDTNASWLSIHEITGVLEGLPENSDVGRFRVNVTVTDGWGGIDFTNFVLTVINTNDGPEIVTSDITTTNEDEDYSVVYSATDIDPGNVLTWTFSSNAPWLAWGPGNHTLYGTPRNEDVGKYSVRINLSDGQGGYDEHFFDLTVINTNDGPVITTADITSVKQDEHYRVPYSAIDVDAGDELNWSFGTNASWLSWGPENHTLYGTPRNEHVGGYLVKIRVTDSAGDLDENQFDLKVENVNDPPGAAEILKPGDGTEIWDGAGLNFSAACDDPDLVYGDKLTFTWYSNISNELGSGQALYNIILPAGHHKISLEVVDWAGEKAVDSIKVVVKTRPKVDEEEPEDGPDDDGDGMPDVWELLHELDPLDPSDAASDSDVDGLTNYEEYLKNTDPKNNDTDGDGLTDGIEINTMGTNASNPDTDSDGYNDKKDRYPLDPSKWKEPDEPEPEPEPEEEDRENEGVNPALIAGIVVIIIIAVIFVFLFILKPRMGTGSEPEAADEEKAVKAEDPDMKSYGKREDQYRSLYGDDIPGAQQQSLDEKDRRPPQSRKT